MTHIGNRMYRVSGGLETERLDTICGVRSIAVTVMTDLNSMAGLHCFALCVHLNAELVACHHVHHSAKSKCSPGMSPGTWLPVCFLQVDHCLSTQLLSITATTVVYRFYLSYHQSTQLWALDHLRYAYSTCAGNLEISRWVGEAVLG
jgi:hypothetical protein